MRDAIRYFTADDVIIPIMDSAKFSRRAFLKTLLAALVVAGCQPQSSGDGGGFSLPLSGKRNTPTPENPPTPTPLPQPDSVAQAYFAALEKTDTGAMYALLTPDSRRRVSVTDFDAAYRYVLNQTTTLSLAITPKAISTQADRAQAKFNVTWHTSLFGDMETEHMMNLRFVAERWGVVWEPMLLMPQLGYGITLVLQEETFPRGDILAADATPLATNGQVISIGVVPGQLQNRAETISALSQLLGMDTAKISAKIDAAQPDWYVPLGEIDLAAASAAGELLTASPGIDARAHSARDYPQGDTAAHIIGVLGAIPAEKLDSFRKMGYRGDEMVGQTGLEAWGEPFLAGKRGGRLITVSPSGAEKEEIAVAHAVPGGNIHLHLNLLLQQRAEELLGNRRGAIVAMKPTGEVLAMATYPRFFPQSFAGGVDAETWNQLLNNPDRPLVNRAAQSAYPPGSVFKIVSMAAAMEKLDMSPDTTFFCSGTWYGLGENNPKKCWLETGHGTISLRDGLTQSCDVVFYEVGKALYEADPALLPEMARAFGLGQTTGILGVDEAAGIVPDNAWKQSTLNEPLYVGDMVNMAIGQGYLLTTPLQVTQMVAAIAAQGSEYRPQVISRLNSRDAGDQLFPAEIARQVAVTPFTLANIQQAMFGVAHGRYGTARKAFDGVGFSVAGKTGTAETGIDAPNAWFAGYAPADTPQVVITVMLENAGEGSEFAAPLFRRMAESYLSIAG